MRPIYDRYRNVKRMLARPISPKVNSLNSLQPIIEGQSVERWESLPNGRDGKSNERGRRRRPDTHARTHALTRKRANTHDALPYSPRSIVTARSRVGRGPIVGGHTCSLPVPGRRPRAGDIQLGRRRRRRRRRERSADAGGDVNVVVVVIATTSSHQRLVVDVLRGRLVDEDHRGLAA